jgi:hypothetical protein
MTLALLLFACAGKPTDLPPTPDVPTTPSAAPVTEAAPVKEVAPIADAAPTTATPPIAEATEPGPSDEPATNHPVPVPEMHQVQLGVDETSTLTGWSDAPEQTLVVTVSKIEDGRCPRDVTCVWAGNAAVSATVTHGEASKSFTLHTAPKMGVDYIDTGLGVAVNLNDVQPYPLAAAKQAAPEATLTLSRLP